MKEFYKKWRKGVSELTPEQHIHAKMVGHGGTFVGMCMAGAVMLYRITNEFDWATVGFLIVVSSLGYLQLSEFRKTRQQLKAMRDL